MLKRDEIIDKDEVLKMARQSGIHYRKFFDEFATANTDGVKIEQMEEFARLVADVATTKEREACAKFIEDGYARQFEKPWREDLAAAIRARGETTLRGEAT